MSDTRTVTITLCLHHDSGSALLVSESGNRDDAVWVPSSQVASRQQIDQRGEVWELEISEFIARDRGLI